MASRTELTVSLQTFIHHYCVASLPWLAGLVIAGSQDLVLLFLSLGVKSPQNIFLTVHDGFV